MHKKALQQGQSVDYAELWQKSVIFIIWVSGEPCQQFQKWIRRGRCVGACYTC